jgi:Transposase IS116/IS110/IS902 family
VHDPGIQRRGAECVIGEIGADMTRFATSRHLASWAGQCPGNDQSAGKRRSGKTRDGSKWLDFALEEAAMAAIRVKGHYLEAQYRRLKPRRGTNARSAPSSTRCSAQSGTCSPPARPTASSAATSSPTATPNARPSASSNSLNASDTTPRSRRRQPDRTFPVRQGRVYRRLGCRAYYQAKGAARRTTDRLDVGVASRMERASGSVTAAFHGCRSAVGADFRPRMPGPRP